MFIKKWLKERKNKANKKAYNRGYDFAAGALLRKDTTPLLISTYIDLNDQINFNDGRDDAIDLLVKVGLIKDDRC